MVSWNKITLMREDETQEARRNDAYNEVILEHGVPIHYSLI